MANITKSIGVGKGKGLTTKTMPRTTSKPSQGHHAGTKRAPGYN